MLDRHFKRVPPAKPDSGLSVVEAVKRYGDNWGAGVRRERQVNEVVPRQAAREAALMQLMETGVIGRIHPMDEDAS